jgi:hypothetical protein
LTVTLNETVGTLEIIHISLILPKVSLKQIAPNLRNRQTEEEKQLWRALRGRQFAGFKFRRQHVIRERILDFYCADAKLAVELDGFQHGLPQKIQKDKVVEKCYWKKESKCSGFGITNGKTIGMDVCWKFGMHCNEGPASFEL